MRSLTRVSLLLVLFSVFSPLAFADHFTADCPLTFVGSASAITPHDLSPHATFKNGSVVYLLRGQTLTTLSVTDTGEVSVAREDFIGTLAARETEGGVAYHNGFLFVSSEAGLEIFDLRNVRPGIGGSPPVRISRTTGVHYRRLTVMGNLLVGLYPAEDLPCTPFDQSPPCVSHIDIWRITNLAAPVLVGQIFSSSFSGFIGFNDVIFANGFLYVTGLGGTWVFDLTNPAIPLRVRTYPDTGSFLVTNGTNLLAVGQEKLIGVFTIGPGPDLRLFRTFTPPSIWNRGNDLMFHQDAWLDNERLITMIDEKNPMTGKAARTIAFDVFDFGIPQYPGYDDRIDENVSMTFPDERKYDPLVVGPFVYVIGELSGSQVWGACGQITGQIEFDRVHALPCGGAEIHGWVTGQHKITQVEVFLDASSLGFATLGRQRHDISSRTPATQWRINVNLDDVTEGEHVLRAIGTDVDGNRRQFSSRRILFPGPGENCTNRRRGVSGFRR